MEKTKAEEDLIVLLIRNDLAPYPPEAQDLVEAIRAERAAQLPPDMIAQMVDLHIRALRAREVSVALRAKFVEASGGVFTAKELRELTEAQVAKREPPNGA